MLSKINNDLSTDITLDEVLDLSITDMFILQYLARFQGSTVRIVLLETLNALLDDNKISTSSFYNRLNKLQKKGLIMTVNETSKRNQEVNITTKAREAIQLINQLNIIGTVDFFKHTRKIIYDLVSKLPMPENGFDNSLIINLEEGIDVNSLQLVSEFSNQTYIVADNETYKRYVGRGLDNEIIQTNISDGTIREAGEFFDAVIILGFECGTTTGKYSHEHWLEEASRVTRPGGMLLINSLARLPRTNHFLVNEMIDGIENSMFFKTNEIEEMTQELEKTGLDSIQTVNYEGLVFTWGTKP